MAKKITCPFEGCSKYFRVRSSFATHISRKHRQQFVPKPEEPKNADVQTYNVTGEHTQVHHDDILSPLESHENNSESNPDTFLKNLALFYLKLQAKLLLPATTVQCIVQEFQQIHSTGMSQVIKKVEEKLEQNNLNETEIQNIVKELEQEDLLTFSNYDYGTTYLEATKWMVSIEGKVAYILDEDLGFADALSVLMASFYAFNVEYQEPACATLEFIQRFFLRINPEDGSKCTTRTGVSRKTGQLVKRKSATMNPRVLSFLCQLTEFEWKNME